MGISTKKQIFKFFIDAAMAVLLILLMAYPVTKYEVHKWIGIAEFILFLLHIILNRRWYAGLTNGKYTPIRLFCIIVNAFVFIAMIGLFISAALLSDMFGLIEIGIGKDLGRILHMLSAYWGFTFISLHIGLHWKMILSKILNRFKAAPKAITAAMRIAASLTALYGLYAFVKNHIVTYMFLKNQFVYFDLSHGPVVFILEYAAVCGLWIFTAHYITKLITKGVMI